MCVIKTHKRSISWWHLSMGWSMGLPNKQCLSTGEKSEYENLFLSLMWKNKKSTVKRMWIPVDQLLDNALYK